MFWGAEEEKGVYKDLESCFKFMYKLVGQLSKKKG